MPNTIRYTRDGGYDEADSREVTGFPTDPTHNYELRRVVGSFFVGDLTAQRSYQLYDDETNHLLQDSQDGIFADFSENSGTVRLDGGFVGDVLRGGSAGDQLNGNAGDDAMEGGAGADRFDGGDGDDTVSYEHAGYGVSVNLTSGENRYSDAAGDELIDVENLRGSDHDDELTGLYGGDTIIEGGAGGDWISYQSVVSYAHSAQAVMVDLNGAAEGYFVYPEGGDANGDRLFFDQSGRIGVVGSANADTLIGDGMTPGTANFLAGNGGLDTIIGGQGADTIATIGEWASVDGGGGDDKLSVRGSAGEMITPDAGTLVNMERVIVRDGVHLDLSAQEASVGIVRIAGEAGSVIGTQAVDRISGGAGDDTIAGGGGADTLRGGGGADTFVYRTASDLSADGIERILDFSGATGERDRIDVSALGITGLHDGPFDKDGSTQLRVFEGANGFSTLTFDLDGDGERDALVRVRSDAPLTADDFNFSSPPPPPSAPIRGDAFSLADEHITPQHFFAEVAHPNDGTALV